MSLYDKASLIQVPSLYKDGLLVSTVPEDRSGDFTFTRGSNLSATRVGPNGYIEKGYENLLLQSNSFLTSPWSLKTGATLTSGISDPDGGTNAWQLNFDGTANARLEQQVSVVNGGVYTFSFYGRVSSGTKDISVGAVGSLTTKTLTTEWQRIEFFGVTTSTITFPQIRTKDTSVYSIEIYQAQFNQGLVAYPYIETTTAPVAGGILEDEPRIDFSDGGGHLLLEPQRTNAVTHSEYLNGLPITTMTITPNATTSPEGVDNASLLLATNNAARVTSDYNSVTAGQKINVSAYIKNINCTNLVFYYYDVQNGIAFSSNNLADELSTEEWRRINYTFTAPQTSSRVQFQFCRIVINGQSLYAYGLQAEQDATYPTSYIPTYGVSQTRLGETCSNAYTNSTGDYFSVFLDYSDFENGNTSGDSSMVFKDSSGNVIFALWGLGLGFVIRSFSGDSNGGYYSSYSFGKTAKALVRYDGSNINLFINGVKETNLSPTETNWNQIAEVDTLRASDNKYKMNKFIVFDSALSDDECIALTSL